MFSQFFCSYKLSVQNTLIKSGMLFISYYIYKILITGVYKTYP